jgi:hypothetical protein
MEIGKTNTLRVARLTDFGYFLEDDEQNEVLLPNAYVPKDIEVETKIDVFVYKDSENRIVATTLKPFAEIDQFAYLKVKQVTKVGAFMDWGLAKDLMVPFAEQTEEMIEGRSYLVFIFEDEFTERIVGSCKENEFIFFDEIDVAEGDEVDLLLYRQTDLGMNAIINNKFSGLIFQSNIHKPIKPGEKIKGWVKKVREDGKIDLLLEPMGYKNVIDINANAIIESLNENNGFLALTDKSDPAEIKKKLGLSKKAFKRGVGYLLKNDQIELSAEGVKLKQ